MDLGAERLVAAERGTEKIAIEIKSFLQASAITDFYGALGQFLSYRLALTALEPDRLLDMAVSLDAYTTFFQLGFTKAAIESYKILLIVYDIDHEVIVEWIN